MRLSIPDAMHSSTAYWISGLSTKVSISFGIAFVAGRNRVPSPATGSTALRTRFGFPVIVQFLFDWLGKNQARRWLHGAECALSFCAPSYRSSRTRESRGILYVTILSWHPLRKESHWTRVKS